MAIKIVKNSIREKDNAPAPAAAAASSRTSRIRVSNAAASSRTSRIRTSNAGASRTRTTANGSRSAASRNDSEKKPPPKRQQSNAWVIWLVVGGFVLLAIILISVSMSGGNRRGTRSPSSYGIQQARGSQQTQYEPKRYAELGGMTMAEWQAKNNTNNAQLKARMGRRRGATGR